MFRNADQISFNASTFPNRKTMSMLTIGEMVIGAHLDVRSDIEPITGAISWIGCHFRSDLLQGSGDDVSPTLQNGEPVKTRN
jgi:hypothetical protein